MCNLTLPPNLFSPREGGGRVRLDVGNVVRVLYSLEISLSTLTKPAPATQSRYCIVIKKKEDDSLSSVNKHERCGNKHITSIWDNNNKKTKQM